MRKHFGEVECAGRGLLIRVNLRTTESEERKLEPEFIPSHRQLIPNDEGEPPCPLPRD